MEAHNTHQQKVEAELQAAVQAYKDEYMERQHVSDLVLFDQDPNEEMKEPPKTPKRRGRPPKAKSPGPQTRS